MNYQFEIEYLKKSRTIADTAIRDRFAECKNMKQIALELGVSTITINRVLDGKSLVNIECIITILQHLQEKKDADRKIDSTGGEGVVPAGNGKADNGHEVG